MLDALHRALDGGVAGDHDDLGIGIVLAEELQDLHAVQVRHLDVQQDDGVGPPGQHLQGRLAARRRCPPSDSAWTRPGQMPVRTASSSSTTRTCWWKLTLPASPTFCPAAVGSRTRKVVPRPTSALHFHRAPVGLHEALDQGQPQAGADDLPGLGMFHPVKFVKDLGDFFGSMPMPLSPHPALPDSRRGTPRRR